MKQASITLFLLCVLLFSVFADLPAVGTVSGGWVGWSMNLDERTPPRNSGLNQDEFEQLLATIQSIGMLFRQMPSLNPPQGVEVGPGRSIYPRVGHPLAKTEGPSGLTPDVHPLKIWPGAGYRGEEGKGPLRGQISIGIFRPVFGYANANCYVRVQFNDPWLTGAMIYEDQEGGMFIHTHRIEKKDGFINHYMRNGVIIRMILPPDREPWLPVSQERWINHLIYRSTKFLEEQRQAMVDGKDERKDRFMRTFAYLQELDPEGAERLQREFEIREDQYARQAVALAARDYDALEAIGNRGLANMGRHLLELEAELSGLSARQRAAPAYGFEYNPQMYWAPRRKPQRPSLLLEEGAPNAFPLLAPNPDFYRRDLPAKDIQVIAILDRLWDEYREAMQIEFNWQALRQMVK